MFAFYSVPAKIIVLGIFIHPVQKLDYFHCVFRAFYDTGRKGRLRIGHKSFFIGGFVADERTYHRKFRVFICAFALSCDRNQVLYRRIEYEHSRFFAYKIDLSLFDKNARAFRGNNPLLRPFVFELEDIFILVGRISGKDFAVAFAVSEIPRIAESA